MINKTVKNTCLASIIYIIDVRLEKYDILKISTKLLSNTIDIVCNIKFQTIVIVSLVKL